MHDKFSLVMSRVWLHSAISALNLIELFKSKLNVYLFTTNDGQATLVAGILGFSSNLLYAFGFNGQRKNWFSVTVEILEISQLSTLYGPKDF